MSADTATSTAYNAFYEIIAYFGAASLALIVASAGFANIDELYRLMTVLDKQGVLIVALASFVFATLTYVYGQVSSALSELLISKPVSSIAKKLSNTTKTGFHYDFGDLVDQCVGEGAVPVAKKNNKWTLIYYALIKVPPIGRDLLKRQARERLARVNATNMLLITLLSILAHTPFSKLISLDDAAKAILHKPSFGFIFGCTFLMLVFTYEFYKRRIWNADLLAKVMPSVLKSA